MLGAVSGLYVFRNIHPLTGRVGLSSLRSVYPDPDRVYVGTSSLSMCHLICSIGVNSALTLTMIVRV